MVINPGQRLSGVIVPVRIPTRAQIDMFKKYLYLIGPCAKIDLFKNASYSIRICVKIGLFKTFLYKKLNSNYTRMLQAILNKSRR